MEEIVDFDEGAQAGAFGDFDLADRLFGADAEHLASGEAAYLLVGEHLGAEHPIQRGVGEIQHAAFQDVDCAMDGAELAEDFDLISPQAGDFEEVIFFDAAGEVSAHSLGEELPREHARRDAAAEHGDGHECGVTDGGVAVCDHTGGGIAHGDGVEPAAADDLLPYGGVGLPEVTDGDFEVVRGERPHPAHEDVDEVGVVVLDDPGDAGIAHMLEIDLVGILGRGGVGVLLIKRAVGNENFVLLVLRDAELGGKILADGRIDAEAVHEEVAPLLFAVHDHADDGALLNDGALHLGAEDELRARGSGALVEHAVERSALDGPIRRRLVLTELADDRPVRRNERPALFLETALGHLQPEPFEHGRIDVVVPIVTHLVHGGGEFEHGDVEPELR